MWQPHIAEAAFVRSLCVGALCVLLYTFAPFLGDLMDSLSSFGCISFVALDEPNLHLHEKIFYYISKNSI